MKPRYRIASVLLVFLAVAIAALGVVLSHNSDCATAPAVAGAAESMKAIVYRCYGSTDVLEFADIKKPMQADDEVLVKVHAASINPLDWHYMRGTPYFMRLESGLGAPDRTGMGVDFAGTVVAVGKNVSKFAVGDAVFGGRSGAFAEYVTVREDRALVLKPDNVTFEEAASAPIAAITALQALRDTGRLQTGQKVLINGASGGVGTFAVQIAKSFGAEVTGVCSTRNVEMVRSIGADFVVDYTKENYTESGKRYDLIVDMVGNHSLFANRRVLEPEGKFVIVGGAKGNWLGPLMAPIKAFLLSPFVGQEFTMMIAEFNQEDLTILANLMREGRITPVIDRSYDLSEVPEAIRYSEEGHARGKIVINLD